MPRQFTILLLLGDSGPMPAMIHKLDDVFGLARDVPLNYVPRPTVDERFVEELSRDKHIVVYGGSKQGKTCLRKHCLNDEDYVVVQCSNKWSLADLHAAILKEAGFKLTLSVERTVTGRQKVRASAGAALFGVGLKAEGAKEDEDTERTVTQDLELEIEDVNDIIRALKSIEFRQFLVLEDFHYLSTEAQQDFAVALKAFHEASNLVFVVVGVWLEENRLIVYNGDLTGRVISINADLWTTDELRQVISDGAALLNIGFAESLIAGLLEACEDSVYIVQEACRRLCADAGVYQTQQEYVELGADADPRAIVKDVVDQQTGRYMSFLAEFARGFQDTDLEMYKWLLYPVLTCTHDQLREGLRYRFIRQAVESRHPKGTALNPGNLTQALQNTASLQVKKNVKPIILDYDQTNLKLSIVDRGFPIWLRHQDKRQLLKDLNLPSDDEGQLNLVDQA